MAGLKQGCTLKNGKYKIVKTLGQGSFGITYLATTHTLMEGQLGKLYVNVNVTIKEFFMCDYSSRAVDGVSVERTNSSLVKYYQNKFHREAINLSKMHHPNIVKVLEVFDENNTTYYVMEFIDGSTVDDYIIKNGKLSVEESLKITKEVCLALAYMHEHNMLHLDLKPKNIMRNNEGHIFLIDFGLAKQYKENGEPESSTSIGLGTPGYAPIEQAYYKSDGTLPVTIDIYALGASLYKMLIGKTPPESSLILNEGLPLTILKQANVDDKVIDIVSKAMAPIKKNRYQTVNALSEAIFAVILSDDESTFVQDHKEDTIFYSAHNNRITGGNEAKEKPIAIKKRKWSPIILGVLLAILPICWKIYNNYLSYARIAEEFSMYEKALKSEDTWIAEEYLRYFADAPNEHIENVKKHIEETSYKKALASEYTGIAEKYLRDFADAPNEHIENVKKHIEETIRYGEALASEDTWIAEEYLRDFADAPNEHIENVKKHFEETSYKEALASEDTRIAKKYLRDFADAPNEHIENVKMHIKKMLYDINGGL